MLFIKYGSNLSKTDIKRNCCEKNSHSGFQKNIRSEKDEKQKVFQKSTGVVIGNMLINTADFHSQRRHQG